MQDKFDIFHNFNYKVVAFLIDQNLFQIIKQTSQQLND